MSPVTQPAAPTDRPSVAIEANPTGKLVMTVGESKLDNSKATIAALSQPEIDALLAKLEPLPAVDNGNAPAVRPPSAAPPRTGTSQPIAFLAPTGKVIADKPVADAPPGIVPLPAPQILPIGEIDAESEIRVRFTEAMVPIADLGKAPPPAVTITPTIAGSWRWVDTRVAMFTPTNPRLPQATEFKITVRAGNRSVTGSVLPVDHEGTFTTPPVMLRGTYPTVKLRPDSPVLVYFDQSIDPDKVAKLLRVENRKDQQRVRVVKKGEKAPKPKTYAFETISLDEAKKRWAKNPAIKTDQSKLAKNFVILAPKTAWPSGMEGRVVLAAGAPSLEGPRVSNHESGTSFHIADKLMARGIACSGTEYQAKLTAVKCAANGYLDVSFTNPIDESTYRSKLVQIDGEPFRDHKPRRDHVTLHTPDPVGKTYKVSIGSGFSDIYGQPYSGPGQLAFTTTPEEFAPYLDATTGLYVIDPRFESPQWVVDTQAVKSLRIELYQVEPKDYFAFQDYETGKTKTPPGKRVYLQDHEIGERFGANARVDLRPALNSSGNGHVVAIAAATPFDKKMQERTATAWIQVSRLGVTARLDKERVHVWTHDITPARFMKPITDITTHYIVKGRTDAPPPAKSDAEGHASYPLLPRIPPKDPDNPPEAAPSLLVASTATDSTFEAMFDDGYEQAVRTHSALWYVTDDRFTYKPDEKLYIKGWVRWTHDGVNPDLELPKGADKIAYTLDDSRGNRITAGTAQFTPQGGFDLEISLPKNVNLGTAMLELETRGETHRHPVSIEEFRTPAYSVSLTDDVMFGGTKPLFLGESIQMTTEAKYFAGGGLPGAAVKWDATLRGATYRPPGWDRYSFSRVRKRSERTYYSRYYGSDEDVEVQEHGTLSGASTSTVDIGIAALPDKGAPSILTVDATVTDVDRQTIRAGSRKIVVHPATVYVGARLKPDSWDVLQLVVTDIDGNVVAGVPIVVAFEAVLGSERHRDDAEIKDTGTCNVVSAATPVECTFKRKDHELAYTATARIADPRGRANEVQYDIPWWSWADNDFTAKLDKKQYKPGDIAKLEVSSGTLPATAIVTLARQGVVMQKRIAMTTKTATVELPVVAGYIPNAHVIVDRIAARTYQDGPKDKPLPEVESTSVELELGIEAARLQMRTRPLQPLIEPGEQATFEVEVKHDDKPVKGAEVALMVVDEAILSISGKFHADPLAPFYEAREDGTELISTMDDVNDAGDEVIGPPGFRRWSLDGLGSGTGSGYGSGSGRGGMRGRSAASPSVRMGQAFVKARKDFRPTAVWAPKLTTDDKGLVRMTVTMPDSLTRYRVVALATSATYNFGKAENNIVAQRKINARTVAPRFLTQGDTFSLPVVVQNLADTPRTVDVAVRAANLAATGPQGKRVTIPGGQRAEVQFAFASQDRGKAVIQTIAISNTFADASQIEIPVYVPATTESFATYGSIDDKTHFEQLQIPASIFPEVGGIEAEVSSTQMQNLTDAYWYLFAYPYECAEQRSSRMLATTSMYDVLDAFAVPGKPSKDKIAEQQAFDIKKLTRDQLANGGWGYYPKMDADRFVTMQVVQALAALKEKGRTIDAGSEYVRKETDKLIDDLAKQVKARDIKEKNRADDAANIALAAAGLSTLAATGADVTTRAVKLNDTAVALGSYPVDAKARILSVLATKPKHKVVREKLLADLLSTIHETAASASVAASYTESERMLLVSSTKTTALVLDALLRESPQHALITKLARGVLDARRGGRWRSTQENLVVLQAMRRYFDIYEKDTPNFTGKLWLGTGAYAEETFQGRSGKRGLAHAAWSTLVPGTTHDIALQKTGPGRMYFRLGITYAPKDTKLPPLDAGFVVRRTYKPVDAPSDVVQLPDGTWKIKLGARVLVDLEAINTTPRYAVAFVDPLPAGFEAVNTRLATAERAAVDKTADRWQHTNMRDNRSEAFSMYLKEGTHRFSYTARATTPGTFIAAPAKAEEMYSPETFGRSGGTTVVIE